MINAVEVSFRAAHKELRQV